MRNMKFRLLLLLLTASIITSTLLFFNIKPEAISQKSGSGNTTQESASNSNNTTAADIESNGSNSSADTAAAAVKEQNENLAFGEILKQKGITSRYPNLVILIDKSDHTLSLVYKGETLKSYRADFGNGGPGDKSSLGDYKTPEGEFYVTNYEVMDPPDYYLGSRWLGVSYPNVEDAERGLKDGLINKGTYNEIIDAWNNRTNPPQDTPLGGSIGIHGGSKPEFGSDWTWGCIGLQNKDIEDFYGHIKVGTKIIVQK